MQDFTPTVSPVQALKDARERKAEQAEKERRRFEKAQTDNINQGWQKTPAQLAEEGRMSEAVQDYIKRKQKQDPLGGKNV